MATARGATPADAVTEVLERLANYAKSLAARPPRLVNLRVPHPAVVSRHTRASFGFIFANTKFSTLRPDVFANRRSESTFEVFGHADLVVRSYGTATEFEHLIGLLRENRVEYESSKVADVLRYYGYVDLGAAGDINSDEYVRLARWVNAEATDTSPAPRGALGIVTLDDPVAPVRLRAFIGIEAAGFGKDRFRTFFHVLLGGVAERRMSAQILNLFSCADGNYEFLVDAYFADSVTLNGFVDEIVERASVEFPNLRVHTATYIVAKVVSERIPAPEPSELRAVADRPERYVSLLHEVTPLLPASETTQAAFDRLPEDRRAYLVSWLWQLRQLAEYADEVTDSFHGVRVEFVEGYVTDNRTRLLSAINALSLALNIAGAETVEQLTRLYFDGNFAEAKTTLGVDTHRQRPAELTVGECKTFLEAWRGKATWSEFVRIPEELSRWIDSLAPARNAAAHREIRADMRELGAEVGPAILSGLRALVLTRNLARLLNEAGQPGRAPSSSDVLGVRLLVVGPAIARQMRELRAETDRLQHELRSRPDEWKTWLAANRSQLEGVINRLESAVSANANVDRGEIKRLSSAAANARKVLAGTADIAQLVSFLGGISSLPWLMQQPAVDEAIRLLHDLQKRLMAP